MRKPALTDTIITLIKWRCELQWSWDATLNCCRDAAPDCCGDAAPDCHGDAALNAVKSQPSLRRNSWDAKIALDASRCECRHHLGRVFGSNWTEIHIAFISHWKAYKRSGSFNSQFILTVHPLRWDPRLKLPSFLKTHKLWAFFQSFSNI